LRHTESYGNGISPHLRGTVYCVVPTHNRLNKLKICIGCLENQEYTDWKLIVVDDGSTDGTDLYVRSLKSRNIHIIRGDGSLWFAGAIHLGINYAKERAEKGDYLLVLNDDTKFDLDLISILVKDAESHPKAIVGTLQKSSADGKVLYKGFSIDYTKLEIMYSNNRVDALPGRGLFIPISILRKIGSVKSFLFPHFMVDIELTARALEMGFRLKVSDQATILTDSGKSDNHIQSRGIFWALFHPRSRRNLFHRLIFFSIRGPVLLRITAIPRYALTRFWKLYKLVSWRIRTKVFWN
jgi:GT2 family glycosyltransferase